MAPQRLFNNKFGNKGRCKYHAVELSLARHAGRTGALNFGLERLLRKHAIGSELVELFKVFNRLLEDVPEHGDRHFASEIVAFKRGEEFACLIADIELIDERIEREQATVVRRNVAFRQTFVNRAKEPLIVHPQRLFDPAAIIVNALQRVFFEQPAILGEGDEQHAVEQLLRGSDKASGLVIIALGEREDQLRPPRLVVLVKLRGDFTLLLTGFQEQLCRVASEQIALAQQ